MAQINRLTSNSQPPRGPSGSRREHLSADNGSNAMPRCRLILACATPFLLGAGALAAEPEALNTSSSAARHWTSDNGNGTYSNPLFYEEFEDPDPIRVGDDYYLAGTTMHMNPALQIMHSKDLVNWELVGYCMERLDLGP